MSRVASVCITLLDNELVANMQNKELLRQAAHTFIYMLHMLDVVHPCTHSQFAQPGWNAPVQTA